MEFIVLIVLVLLAISGWAFSMYVNDGWFKDSIKTTEKWFNHCMEINNIWYERNVELAKKVDELTAEKEKFND